MRLGLFLALVGLALASGAMHARSPAPDPAALQKRLTALEAQIAALQREAAELRKQLDQIAPPKAVILSPQEAVAAFKKNPGQPVTVEFGVREGTGAIYSGTGPDPLTFIVAVWDQRLEGGGTFRAIIREKAFSQLTIPAKEKGKPRFKPPPDRARELVARHIDVNGVRVTGVVRKGGGASFAEDYYIDVDDPAKVVLFNSIAPKAIRQR